MTLFECRCPHCGQPMPDTQVSGFEAWWKEYPARSGKKVGKAKAGEYYAKAAKLVSEELLLATVKSYAASCKRTDTFPVDAFRWLRDRRWIDESLEKTGDNTDALQWWANQINAGRKMFALPSRDMMVQLVQKGLVEAQRMKEVAGI